jgi:hypothetical protein
MNPRERALAILLIGVVILGGGGLFGYQFGYKPWQARTKTLATLNNDYRDKVQRRDDVEREKVKLARWMSLSLPGDPEVANREYEKYLSALLNHHEITNGREVQPGKLDANNKTAPATSDKQPIYTRLSFKVHAYASEDKLMAMLKDFYATGLMHQIRSLMIQKQLTPSSNVRADELELNMTVEALVITGADRRPYLMPNFDRNLMAADVAVSALGGGNSSALWLWTSLSPGLFSPGRLAEPMRDYTAIGRKNIFLGRVPRESNDKSPEWMAPRYVHITDITPGTLRTRVTLYDVSTNIKKVLKDSSGSPDTFSFVKDGDGNTILDGAVVKVDAREITYRAEFHVGDTVAGLGLASHFTRLSKADREAMLADGTLKTEDADGVLRVDRPYWEMLLRTQVVRTSGRDGFRVQLEANSDRPAPASDDGGQGFGGGISQSVEVLRGKIVFQDGSYVYLRPEEPYYVLHLGDSVEDSLKKKPLPAEKVKALKAEMASN